MILEREPLLEILKNFEIQQRGALCEKGVLKSV